MKKYILTERKKKINKKNLFAVLLAAMLACGTMTMGVLAEETADVDVVAELAADVLPEAVDGVVTLTEDVVLISTIAITEDTTTDLAGHTITSADVSG